MTTEHNQAANIVLTTRTDSYKEILPALAAYFALRPQAGWQGKLPACLFRFKLLCPLHLS